MPDSPDVHDLKVIIKGFMSRTRKFHNNHTELAHMNLSLATSAREYLVPKFKRQESGGVK